MARKTLFLDDVYGAGWEHELGDDARIEPREPVVRGLSAHRYRQLWSLFPDEPHNDILFCLSQGFDITHTGEMVGLSPRQVKNAIAGFLRMAQAAYGQPSFLPPPTPPAAGSLHIERRPRSRRGRPPKGRTLPAPTQTQVPLPF